MVACAGNMDGIIRPLSVCQGNAARSKKINLILQVQCEYKLMEGEKYLLDI